MQIFTSWFVWPPKNEAKQVQAIFLEKNWLIAVVDNKVIHVDGCNVFEDTLFKNK